MNTSETKAVALHEHLKTNSQASTGLLIGRSQGAISQMIAEKRQVFLEFDGNGKYLGWSVLKRTKKAS